MLFLDHLAESNRNFAALAEDCRQVNQKLSNKLVATQKSNQAYRLLVGKYLNLSLAGGCSIERIEFKWSGIS